MMNIKMKKTLTIAMICAAIVICLIVAAICIWVYVVLPIGEKYRSDGAVELALDYYEFDEVLFVSWVSRLNNLIVDNKRLVDGVYSPEDEFSEYYNYVLGVKDGKEVAILVPRLKAQKHCKSEWFFDKSFGEISQMLEKKSSIDYSNAVIYNNKDSIREHISQADGLQLDKDIALVFGDKAVVQVDGQIRILQVDK